MVAGDNRHRWLWCGGHPLLQPPGLGMSDSGEPGVLDEMPARQAVPHQQHASRAREILGPHWSSLRTAAAAPSAPMPAAPSRAAAGPDVGTSVTASARSGVARSLAARASATADP